MTVMKYGVYALVAVVFGVVLVGLLPGQLSNMVTPITQKSPPQGTESSGGGTLASGGSDPSRYNSSAGNGTTTSNWDTTTAASTANITATPKTGGEGSTLIHGVGDPYNDIKYYGMMGVGLAVSLGVYLLARRVSG